MGFFTPAENASNFINVGLKKTTEKPIKIFLLAVMAGAFIAITGSGVGVATHAITASKNIFIGFSVVFFNPTLIKLEAFSAGVKNPKFPSPL